MRWIVLALALAGCSAEEARRVHDALLWGPSIGGPAPFYSEIGARQATTCLPAGNGAVRCW